MKKSKLGLPVVVIALLLLAITYASAQQLLVHVWDNPDNTAEDSTYSVQLGDIIAVAYQKSDSSKIHYFQGKVTGIFQDRGVVRIFDYGRSSRLLAISGKKVHIKQIVAVKQLDKTAFKNREKAAVAMAMVSSLGAGIGGRTGTGIQLGGTAGRVGNDLITRERISKQNISIEFKN